MKLVAIDTCGPVIGVALWCDGAVSVRTERVSRGAEARLTPWVKSLAAEAGVALSSLDGIAVTRGPGAFTGIRVGLATAVGLALALDRPLWATDSLSTRLARASADVALLDARKGRVYACHPVDGLVDVAPEVALGWRSGAFTATGEGALAYEALVRAAGGIVAPEADDPAVDALARLAARGFVDGGGVDAVDVGPLYVRDADVSVSG